MESFSLTHRCFIKLWKVEGEKNRYGEGWGREGREKVKEERQGKEVTG